METVHTFSKKSSLKPEGTVHPGNVIRIAKLLLEMPATAFKPQELVNNARLLGQLQEALHAYLYTPLSKLISPLLIEQDIKQLLTLTQRLVNALSSSGREALIDLIGDVN